jgi:hypothetical protein
MKKLLLTALVLLFTLSTAGLRSEISYKAPLQQIQAKAISKGKKCDCEKNKKHKKEELKCHCESKCSLPCLKSESCNLTFNLTATSPDNDLAGSFLISIIAPNGDVVATTTIQGSNIPTQHNDDDTPTLGNFLINVPAPICAGHYTVVITNQGVDLDDSLGFVPFTMIAVTNSCNSQSLVLPVPINLLGLGIYGLFEPGILPDGSSTEIDVNIFPTFLHFEKCETKCECKKKCGCDKK